MLNKKKQKKCNLINLDAKLSRSEMLLIYFYFFFQIESGSRTKRMLARSYHGLQCCGANSGILVDEVVADDTLDIPQSP